MKFLAIDFEFTDTTEETLTVLCCCCRDFEGKEYIFDFVRDPLAKGDFNEFILEKTVIEGYTLVAHAYEAECRAMISLGVQCDNFNAIDTHLEYKMLLNKNDQYQFGQHLLEGKVQRLVKPLPKWERKKNPSDKEASENKKASTSYASACYKMLGIKIDTDRKTRVRDMIINKTYTADDMDEIIEYCLDDVKNLIPLSERIKEAIKKSGYKKPEKLYYRQAMYRAKYSYAVATMTQWGYPVDVPATRSFAGSVDRILTSLKHDINRKLKDKIGFEPFNFDKKKKAKKVKDGNGRLINLGIPQYNGNQREKMIKDYILEKRNEGIEPYKSWPLSKETKQPSLAIEVLEDLAGGERHSYKDTLIDQLRRYAKTKQALNGFMPPAKGRKNFFDFLGSDGRARSYFNHFGSQTGRSQPSSTSFIPLKAAWMRYLIQPPEGKTIVTIDYGSEEYLIAALLSKDKAMTDSYCSGDVYIDFMIKAGLAPKGATKKSHPKERELGKPTTLMTQYGAGGYGLAQKANSGKAEKDKISEEEAQNLIDLFHDTYPDYADFKESISEKYYEFREVLTLKDGWTLFLDNENDKSVRNFPIQGSGAVIMRLAHLKALKKGLKVIWTLHDALAIECETTEWQRSAIVLAECMDNAFSEVCGKGYPVRLDGAAWGYDFPAEGDGKETLYYESCCPHATKLQIPVKTSQRYIDERAVEDFKFFEQYLRLDLENIL